MRYRGQVQQGVVILEPNARLPEGAVVSVEPWPTEEPKSGAVDEENSDSLARMGELAVETGVRDLAVNVDHYLYGHPKADHES